jgi:hypothetical protein
LASTGWAAPQPRVDHHAKADRNRGQRAAQGTSGGWRTAYFHAHIPATCQRPSELCSRRLNGRLMLRATCCRLASRAHCTETSGVSQTNWSHRGHEWLYHDQANRDRVHKCARQPAADAELHICMRTVPQRATGCSALSLAPRWAHNAPSGAAVAQRVALPPREQQREPAD